MNNRFIVLFVAVFCFVISVTVISNHIVLAANNYKSPLDLATTKDGSKIYVALFDAHEIAVLNTSENKIVQTISVGKEPTGIVLSPYLVDGKLSERAERGKKIFEDTKIGCVQCHPAPLFTNQKLHNVNTKCYYDRRDSFDTPTLIETWRTAPYLHDGRYINLKDLFKKGKHGNTESNIESLTEEQLDDLIEYVLSL